MNIRVIYFIVYLQMGVAALSVTGLCSWLLLVLAGLVCWITAESALWTFIV
jgi:hypothetical protein